MAKNVSRIGTPAARIGTNSETNKADRATANREMMPNEKPRSNAPESPIKIDAGKKLDFRKPAHTPTRMTLNSAASKRPVSTANSKMVIAEIPVIPAAKPSRPSIKLITLAKATR